MHTALVRPNLGPHKTLVWLLLVVTCHDLLTTSQAEVPLEQIHVIYRKWVCSVVVLDWSPKHH